MKVHHRRRIPQEDATVYFGDKCTAETLFAKGEHSQGRCGEKYAVVIFDLGTDWVTCAPVCERSGRDAEEALRMFAGPNAEIKSFYSDNANELRDAAKSVKWCHTTNTPFVSCTNGRVERRIRHVEEGTRTVLARAGFPHRWWPHASRYFCHTSNIRERDDESPSAWEARRGAPFGGMRIPFSAAVRFAPPTL